MFRQEERGRGKFLKRIERKGGKKIDLKLFGKDEDEKGGKYFI